MTLPGPGSGATSGLRGGPGPGPGPGSGSRGAARSRGRFGGSGHLCIRPSPQNCYVGESHNCHNRGRSSKERSPIESLDRTRCTSSWASMQHEVQKRKKTVCDIGHPHGGFIVTYLHRGAVLC